MTDTQRISSWRLYSAALIGGLVAALADLLQKSEASALRAITQQFREVFLLDVTPLLALVCILLLGVASCFIFEPRTKPSAFNRGLGVIALLATSVPYKPPPDFQSEMNAPTRIAFSILPQVIAASTQEVPSRQRSQVEVRLNPKEGELHSSTITLLDPSTKKILAQSVTTSRNVFFARSPGTYILEVNSDGFQAVKDTVVVGEGLTQIEIPLEPARFPVLEQLLAARKGDFIVKTLPPPMLSSAPSALMVKNTAAKLNTNEWGWTIFVDGPEELLERVECVEYTLHPTFRERVQKVCQRGEGQRPFSLSARGWGTFEVGVRVFLKDGSTQDLTHQLKFE